MTQSPDRTAILLIAHGSRQAAANDDLHQLAGRIAARGGYPIVEPSFLELAEPDIPEGGARCVARGAGRVLMVPYFLSAGVHLARDLIAARDRLRQSHPGVEFRLGPPLGPHPLLDELVARRIQQVATEMDATGIALSTDCDERYPSDPASGSAGEGSDFAGESRRIDTNPSKG
jgi:sirohydrochlorin ferrochelatase